MRDNVPLSTNVARALRVLAFGLLALWTFSGLERPIGDGDEVIHAEILRQMLRTGDYLHTHWYGIVLHERPALTYWLALPFAALSSSEICIRMSSALLSFVTLMLVYRVGCRLWSQPTAALTGTILLAASPSYHDYTRTLMSEAPYVLATTVALWGSLLALQERRGLLLAAAGLGAGIAIKSLAGALPLLALAPWLIRAAWVAKKHGHQRTVLTACAIFLALALPYFVIGYFDDPDQFLREHIGFHLLQRASQGGSLGLRGGLTTYLASIPALDGPWIALWLVTSIAAGLALGRSTRSPQLLLLSSYALLFFIAMSCLSTHSQHYILPLYPAAALASSGALAYAMSHWPRLQKPIWRMLAPALAAFTLIVSLPYPGGRVILLEGPAGKVLGSKARELAGHEQLFVYEWYGMSVGYYADRPIVLLTTSPARFAALNIPDHALARAHVPALVPPLPAAAGQRILIAGHVNDLSHASWFKVDQILAAAPPYFLARVIVEQPVAREQASANRAAHPR
jgi:4-amino-4-deoxy-L-arabinose transferase-like glycosyltransferase